MNRMFDPDSWFMQLLGRFSNLVILNFLFLFTCIPIFTVGASLTALYDVVLRMDTERETPTVSTYFRSFRANFRQSTQVFLIMAPLIAVSCVNLAISSRIRSAQRGFIILRISRTPCLLNLLRLASR